jgi:hypothetical protein
MSENRRKPIGTSPCAMQGYDGLSSQVNIGEDIQELSMLLLGTPGVYDDWKRPFLFWNDVLGEIRLLQVVSQQG